MENISTLNLRKIEIYPKELQDFAFTLEEAFLNALNTYVSATKRETEALQLQDTIETILLCLNNNCAPGDHFDYFSCGAFKEAYLASDSIIVKFCSNTNETCREQRLLEEAKTAGLIDLFVPTTFIELPTSLPITHLDGDSDKWVYNSYYHTYVENEDYDDWYLDYLEIQPRVSPASAVPCEYLPWDYQNLEISNTLSIPRAMINRVSTTNKTWLLSIVENYGLEKLKEFAMFCDDHHIWDLHNDNIGFTISFDGKEIPIILDWMSD